MNAATGIRTQATGATSRGHAPRLWRHEKARGEALTFRCVHRDSNPNLNLGRVKYYPCTMDAACEGPRRSGAGCRAQGLPVVPSATGADTPL